MSLWSTRGNQAVGLMTPSIPADLTQSDYSAVSNTTVANTPSSWVELTASLPVDAHGVIFNTGDPSFTSQDSVLMDYAIGPASSEQIVIEGIPHDQSDSGACFQLYMPITIPRGTRIAARHQIDDVSSTNIVHGIQILGQTFLGDQSYAAIQTSILDRADSRGLEVDPGGTIDTKGSWFELMRTRGIPRLFTYGIGRNDNGALTGASVSIDIGIGESGSEVVLMPDLPMRMDNGFDNAYPYFSGPFPFPNVPEGSRLVVRASSTINDATDRLFTFFLYLLR